MSVGQEKEAAPKAPAGQGNKLIQEKKRVQLELKDINRRVKELKQLLRGGRIDEPLNPALPELAQKLVQDMGNATNEVKDLATEQGEYAAKRQGKSPGPAGPPVADVPTSQPAEPKLELPPALLQAASLELPPHLASSRWSRFMSTIKTPFQFGDRDRWDRLKLLRTASDINSSLKDIENAVLTGQDIAIPSAIYKAGALYHVIEDSVVEQLMGHIGQEDKATEQAEEPVAAPEEPQQQPDGEPSRQEENDIGMMKLQVSQRITGWTGADGQFVEGYNNKIRNADARLGELRLRNVNVPEEVKALLSEASNRLSYLKKMVHKDATQVTIDGLQVGEQALVEILSRLEAKINYIAQSNDINLEEAVQPPEPTAEASAEYALLKLAQTALDRKLTHNILSRYLKRKWVAVFGGPTRGLRLSAAQSAREARQSLDGFMDTIEEGLSYRQMGRAFIPFLDAFAKLLPRLVRLGDEFNKYALLESQDRRLKGKKNVISTIRREQLNQLNQMQGKKSNGQPDLKTPGLLRMIGRLQAATSAAAPAATAPVEEEEEAA